ncbi:DUF1569 domain-containing protein [Pseudobacter ginsenosidimutans]|uniref:Uncharacterized protein DUF1569 n=1 Tax=Pseudobacter ginsenosidimutans TaxID=661488 RepID=A0A4Q7MZK8_9BACT|nr:DUF1569 domain-containing protein [Pseudobacter ginsenosidimutans]QEC43353.1 DUF1569 domain-containing protein [Pseudobacter ginsenosidimutans]RZS74717.1 uncharacterized protein DUF1569 [Pseudobacter ginsenosidimutans]
MKNIFQHAVSEEIIQRINQLTPDSQRQWGKMSVDQMLAHCNVPYAYTFHPENFKKPGGFTKFILRTFVKKAVVSETPYKKNGRTAPEFIINGGRDFQKEKTKLIENIRKAQELGQQYFDGKENISFGKMTATEWNNMFYKHLDHHLSQFGV